MLFVSLVFASLLLITPPLILSAWVILFARLGLLGSLFERVKALAVPRKALITRNRGWTILAIGIFGISIILCLGLDLWLLIEGGREWEANISEEVDYSNIILSFLYSPIMPILVLEAWLVLISYFGFQYMFYRFGLPTFQRQRIRNLTVTTIHLIGILTGLIGFIWWSYTGITNQSTFHSINNFSMVELSSTTVLLTIGLVVTLFISLSKIEEIEENTQQHEQVARKMFMLLLSTLVLLSLIGGILSTLIHYDRFRWYGIGS